MKVLLLLSFLAACTSDVLTSPEECPIVFQVERTVGNHGFHRIVDYYFEIVSDGNVGGCKICFKQTIPRGLYVNKDEIAELVRFGKLAAVVEEPVDVEAPADRSPPHEIIAHVELLSNFNTMNATVAIPIHTRYHQARQNGGFDEAVLPHPEVALSCDSIPLKCQSSERPLQSCPAALSKSEQYVSMDYETRERPSEILIPVGNSSQYEIVQLFTFIVTWAGSKFIYYTLMNNKPKDWI